MFDHAAWNRQFLAYYKQNGRYYSDVAGYGVSVQVVMDAQWRVIGVHHLPPDENRGNHHAYFDALDENGNRIYGTVFVWDWQGRKPGEVAPPVAIDKPANEPGTNIALGPGQIISAWVTGAKSDVVKGIHTAHADEGSTGWNTRFHHSFYVVVQRGPSAAPVIPGPTPTDCSQYITKIGELQTALIDVQAILRSAMERINRET